MAHFFAKRFMDITISLTAIVAFLPFSLLIIPTLVMTDPGPVFFMHERIGRNGKKFFLWKFRTMQEKKTLQSAQITLGSRDPRITPVGYYLRMTKLDEFPQFWNVLKGDMSLVGPRPEVEKYVRLYTKEQKRVLEVRPGCTDLAVIRGHLHDEALLDEHQENPEAYYIKTIMPRKLVHNLYYVDHQSFWLDLKILVCTFLFLLRIRKNQTMTCDITTQ